ncbi:hypothetical protein ACQ4LE_000521 [Meloidogyne hapla]
MSPNDISTVNNDFWEIGNYKANITRIHQGYEQLEDITRFIKDRVAIEASYSKQLEKWNSEWSFYAEKHFNECLSLKKSFDLILGEGKELAKVHFGIRDRFIDEILKTIELFKRDNYHKSKLRGFKEAKEVEDEFEKAQKQWKKLFERLQVTKRNYHSLSRAEKSAYIQYMNSKADEYVADFSSEKCKERFEKLQEDRKKAKAIYEQQLTDVKAYIGIYKENMSFVFEKCQRMERKRMKFMIEMFSGIQKIMAELISPQKLLQLQEKLRKHFAELNDASIEIDLRQWSLNHGIESNTIWPEFEEYSSEFRQIHNSNSESRKHRRQKMEATTGVMLTRQIPLGDGEPINEIRKSRNSEEQNLKHPRCNSEPRCHNLTAKMVNSEKSSIPDSTFFLDNDLKKENGKELSMVSTNEEYSKLVNRSLSVNPSIKHQQLQYNSHQKLNKSTESTEGNSPSSLIPVDPLPTKSDNERNQSFEYKTTEKLLNVEQLPPQLPLGPAKVIYNFDPNEPDELPLVLGEIIEVLSGPDNLGWCLGVKKNKERGLFPATYVSPQIQIKNK